jgi:hypothetical protein
MDAMLDRGAVVKEILIEGGDACSLVLAELTQLILSKLMDDMPLPLESPIHEYDFTLRKEGAVRLNEHGGVEDHPVRIVSTERAGCPDDETEGVSTDEVVLRVEVLVGAVILALLPCWNLDLAMGAIENPYCRLTGGEEAVEGATLVRIRPSDLPSPCIIHCLSDMICHPIRRSTADVIEDNTQKVGVIAVTIP